MEKWLPPMAFHARCITWMFQVGGTYKMSFTNFGTGIGQGFGRVNHELVPFERIRFTDRFDHFTGNVLSRLARVAGPVGHSCRTGNPGLSVGMGMKNPPGDTRMPDLPQLTELESRWLSKRFQDVERETATRPGPRAPEDAGCATALVHSLENGVSVPTRECRICMVDFSARED
jgi:hypothetical protein